MAISSTDLSADQSADLLITLFSKNPTKRQSHKEKVREAAPSTAVRATIV
jgi:hypothetical protein